jgi:hypothetical protein
MKKFIVIFNILFLALMFSAVNAQESEFVKLISQNSYINPHGIVYNPDDGTYSVIIKSYNKGQYEPVNGRFISYTLSQHFIDCQNATYKLGLIDSYDDEDNFVNGDYNRFATYQPIIQGNSSGAVYNLICKP